MSAKLLTRLAGGLVAVIIVWVVLAFVRRPPEDRGVSLAIPRVDTASVDSIVFARRNDTAAIVRVSKRWMTNGFAADSTAVASLLTALADSGRRTELAAESRASHERLGVAADSGLRLRVHVRGSVQPVLDLIAGARTSDYGGVFIRQPANDAVYSLHGSLFEPLTRSLDDWRDKRIVSVTQDSVARIEIRRAGRSYTLTRSGKSWSLGGKLADSTAVMNLLGDYRELRATGFPSRAQADSLDFKKPKAAARLLSSKGATLVDLAFDSTAGGAWARASSGGPVYKVDAFTWGRLAPAESTVAAKPKKPTTKS